MRTPDPIKEERLRAEILHCAKALFQRHGLAKTSMEDISKAAGKGRSTLYYYYKSKEDVFSAIARLELSDIISTIEKAVGSGSSATEKLRKFMITHSSTVRSKARLYPIIFQDKASHTQLFHDLQRELNMAEIRILKNILEQGSASGEFKNIKKVDIGTFAIVAITALHGMDINLLLDGKTPSAETKISAITDILIKGLR